MAPTREILINRLVGTAGDFMIYIIRISPYPPSFRSTAARIMDPAMGASTWAFGNHRWVINIGIFTSIPPINRR